MAGNNSTAQTDEDRLIRRVLWSMPSGLYVVGSKAGDRFNAMTLNLAIQVSLVPRRIGIAVLKTAFTKELIEESGVFALSLLDRKDRAAVRKFVKPVDHDAKKSTLNGFGFRSEISGAPILDIAQAWIDCRVHQSADTGDHIFFVGDVLSAAFSGDAVGSEDFEILRMEDTRMNYGG